MSKNQYKYNSIIRIDHRQRTNLKYSQVYKYHSWLVGLHIVYNLPRKKLINHFWKQHLSSFLYMNEDHCIVNIFQGIEYTMQMFYLNKGHFGIINKYSYHINYIINSLHRIPNIYHYEEHTLWCINNKLYS